MKTLVLPKSNFFEFPSSIIYQKISDFVLVGRLLHLTALISALMVIFFWRLAWESWINENMTLFVLYTYLTLYMLSIPIFAELDARSRYQNFKMVRDLFFKFGYKSRFIKSMQYSKCQREAAIMAGRETGYAEQVNSYFRSAGRKWYHYFPSFILTKPTFLFTKQFWITTFFVKYYPTKYYNY